LLPSLALALKLSPPFLLFHSTQLHSSVCRPCRQSQSQSKAAAPDGSAAAAPARTLRERSCVTRATTNGALHLHRSLSRSRSTGGSNANAIASASAKAPLLPVLARGLAPGLAEVRRLGERAGERALSRSPARAGLWWWAVFAALCQGARAKVRSSCSPPLSPARTFAARSLAP